MKKELVLAAIGALLGSCHSTPRTNSLKGMVTDATMNTVTLVGTKADTASFSTMNADKTELEGLLIGDSVEVRYAGEYQPGMEALKVTTLSKASANNLLHLFKNGIRVEAVQGERKALYLCFALDSLRVDVYDTERKAKETLGCRTLPTGEHVWNVEDDDTKNVRYADGRWTVNQRGKLVYEQRRSDNDSHLGEWKETHYEGVLPAADCPGIEYRLTIRHREHSGDGSFWLQLTYLEAQNGKNMTYAYTGKRITQRGIPSDANAIVWQLVPDQEEYVYNFLCEKDGQLLTLLNGDFERNSSELNYTLKRIE